MQHPGENLRATAVLGTALVFWLLAPQVAGAQTTVVLSPSGGDDTIPLAAAFDAAIAAGPGSTVELLPGIFRISEPVLIRSFSGTWHGAGMGKTVIEIEGTGGGPFPLTSFGPLDPAFPGDPPFDGFSRVFVFGEVQGGAPTDLRLSDLSFRILGESEPWQQAGLPFLWHSISTLINVERTRGGSGPPGRTSANLRVDRVEVVGELISSPPAFSVIENLFNFVRADGVPGGNELEMALQVTRSRFEFCDRMVLVLGLVDSEIIVGGLPPHANLFHAGTNAFNFINLQNSAVEISHNRVSTHGFVFIQNFSVPAVASDFHFHHNTVEAAFLTDYWPSAAIWIVDFAAIAGGRSANVVIEHNYFAFARENPFGIEDGPDPLNALIEGVVSAGVVVRQNRISGPYDEAAIEFGVGSVGPPHFHPPLPNPEVLLIGNNVQHVEAGVAPIWLGPGSSNSTVRGNPNEVLDQGTNNDVSGQ